MQHLFLGLCIQDKLPSHISDLHLFLLIYWETLSLKLKRFGRFRILRNSYYPFLEGLFVKFPLPIFANPLPPKRFSNFSRVSVFFMKKGEWWLGDRGQGIRGRRFTTRNPALFWSLAKTPNFEKKKGEQGYMFGTLSPPPTKTFSLLEKFLVKRESLCAPCVVCIISTRRSNQYDLGQVIEQRVPTFTRQCRVNLSGRCHLPLIYQGVL